MDKRQKIRDKQLVYQEINNLRYKKGYTKFEISKHLMEKYGIKTTQSYNYIKEAMALTAEVYNKLNENALVDSIFFLEDLKMSTLKDGNKKLVLEISKELNKIQQLYVEKLDITSGGEPIKININKIGN